MAGCPFNNFKECPQHNKNGGCEFWISYITNRKDIDAHMEGCAIILTPMLLIENVNNLQVTATAINGVAAEINKARVENIKENTANREQLCSLARGERTLINPNYNLIEDKK